MLQIIIKGLDYVMFGWRKNVTEIYIAIERNLHRDCFIFTMPFMMKIQPIDVDSQVARRKSVVQNERKSIAGWGLFFFYFCLKSGEKIEYETVCFYYT